MIHPREALSRVLEAARPATARYVPLSQAVGLRLAEDVRADRDFPPFDRAMMDGYAVSLPDIPGRRALEIVGLLAAGEAPETGIRPGTCIEIMTGAACPPGTAAVVQKELVRRDGNQAVIPTALRSGQNIAPRASESAEGNLVLRIGDRITPLAVGALAALGRRQARVVPLPVLGILVTGGEIAQPGDPLASVRIHDSNGPMLGAMALLCGLAPPRLLYARDDVQAIAAAIEELQGCDLVIITGGVSAGQYDLVPDCLRELRAEVVFHKVAQKPGKPMLFARCGAQLLFGLPGNPLAAHLCFHRYVCAAIRRMTGNPPTAPPQSEAELLEPVHPAGPRTWFLLAEARRPAERSGCWRVQPLVQVTTADLVNTNQANCYVEVPPGEATFAAGAHVAIEWLMTGRCACRGTADRSMEST